MKRAWTIAHQAACGLVLLLGFAGVCRAGSFQVNPVKLVLSANKPVAALTVHNLEGTSTVVQLRVMAWSQAGGKDQLTPTTNLLATPPIFTLKAHATQIVRVGIRQPPDKQSEQSYRLFLREIPPPLKPDFKGLRMALRISLPVFVQPAQAVRPRLHWSAITSGHGRLEIRVSNAGSAHAKLSRLRLVAADAAKALPMPHQQVYVLPGTTHEWVLHAAGKVGERLRLTALENASVPLKVDMLVGDNTTHSNGP